MKFAQVTLMGLLAAIVGAAIGLVVVTFGFGPAGGFGSFGGGGEDGAARLLAESNRAALRELDERIARLERGLGDLARAEPAREAVNRLPQVHELESADPDAARRAAAAGALDPRRLLAEYVASFEGGGAGSEFFRMAVAAYAWQLRRELQSIAGDRDAPDALRLQVMEMFEGGSFRGDSATIDALLGILRQGGWEAGATTALGVLAKIGDRRTAELIEAVTPSLEPLRVRAAAWSTIAQLCGGDADSVLLRLLEREHDPEGRALLIALFRGTDLAATLRAYELASRMEQNVRLDAAGRIGRFRDERFGALIDDWLTREDDEEVRARLLAAKDQQRQVPGWNEMQATGPPDVSNPARDDSHAWASAAPDGGTEWIELTYSGAMAANRVTIHEVCSASCVSAVDVFEEGGTWRNVWTGNDPLTSPGPFEVRFATTGRVSKVRVTLDTKRRAGWNEIDAVELAGPDGSAWAAHATASSRYGEGSSFVDSSVLRAFEGFKVDGK